MFHIQSAPTTTTIAGSDLFTLVPGFAVVTAAKVSQDITKNYFDVDLINVGTNFVAGDAVKIYIAATSVITSS